MGVREPREAVYVVKVRVKAKPPVTSMAWALYIDDELVPKYWEYNDGMLHQVIPEATFKRRRDHLKPEESERTERLARVIATAHYVWDDEAEARRFLITPHAELDGVRPIEVALTELGARRVEELLWKLFYGVAV